MRVSKALLLGILTGGKLEKLGIVYILSMISESRNPGVQIPAVLLTTLASDLPIVRTS